jgi:hypothetical protein
MKRVLFVLAIVAALLVGGGIAYASIPGPDGVIHGCRKNTDGSLRVIDSTATCPNGWTALNWSQTGPQGPPGISGYEVVTVTESFADVSTGTAIAMCPAGKRVIGGGGGTGHVADGGNTDYYAQLSESRPMYPPNVDGWYVLVRRDDNSVSTFDLVAFAICANVTS